MSESPPAPRAAEEPLGVFGRYLTLWVLLCIVIGTALGVWLPGVVSALEKAKTAQISAPVAVLLWLMIYPMAIKVDFASLRRVRQQPRAIGVTCFVNWAVQPFLMFALALAFYRGVFRGALDTDVKRDDFVAGAVILGGSPCTAMVFVWSALSGGHPGYTLVQVAVNDILIFILYTPTLLLLLQATVITIPYDTIVLSVVLFVAVPFAAGAATRHYFLRRDGGAAKLERFLAALAPVTVVALLLTLVLIFMFQGQQMVDKPVDLLIASAPLVLQTYLVFIVAFGLMYWLRVPFDVAAPGAFIASSNFFELGVGVAISAYGADSSATLVNVAGVLTEVPVMLSLVRIALALKHHFPEHHGGMRGTETPHALKDVAAGGVELPSAATAGSPRDEEEGAAGSSSSSSSAAAAVATATAASAERSGSQDTGGPSAQGADPSQATHAEDVNVEMPAVESPSSGGAAEPEAPPPPVPAPTSVLFLCVGNSCRSQMAHGWAEHIATQRGLALRVQSAGSAPTLLNPFAVRAMAEAGVDISHHAPKRVSSLQGEPFDCVVTLCGTGDAQCPAYLVGGGDAGALHRPFEDPSHMGDGSDMEQYRRVRDQIGRFVARLLGGQEPADEEGHADRVQGREADAAANLDSIEGHETADAAERVAADEAAPAT